MNVTHGSLKSAFLGSMRRHAHRTAISTPDSRLTYADLDRESERASAQLWAMGTRPGQRVALFLPNSADFFIWDIAIMRVGAVKVPLNTLLSAHEIGHIVGHSEASVLVTAAGLVDTARKALSANPAKSPMIVVGEDADSIADGVSETAAGRIVYDETTIEAVDSIEVSAFDPAVIYYTGGTTGLPKGVLHNQLPTVLNLHAHIVEGEIGSDEKLLLMTPLAHAAGLFGEAALLRGATALIDDGFDAVRMLTRVSRGECSWAFMVPTMIYRTLDAYQADSSAFDVSGLRTIVYGAAAIIPARLADGLAAFGPVFVQLYAQTECPNWGTRLSKDDHLLALGARPELLSSCGRASLMADVCVMDEKLEPVGSNRAGEICLRAPYTLDSYYRNEQATKEKFVGEWIRTGDLGEIDAEGYVYLKDRLNDMIVSGGLNVYSTEVERVLGEHPDVAQVAVLGIPDDDWGEAVYAVVVPRDAQLTAEALVEYCQDRLATYMRPKTYEFVAELPLTPFGKTDKKALRKVHWHGEDRAIH